MSNNTQEHHISYGTLVMVWAGLIALTAITVSVAGINFGGIALIIALAIASTKSLLVMNYFMHIKYDSPIFKVFVVVCFLTLFIIIILTFSDLLTR